MASPLEPLRVDLRRPVFLSGSIISAQNALEVGFSAETTLSPGFPKLEAATGSSSRDSPQFPARGLKSGARVADLPGYVNALCIGRNMLPNSHMRLRFSRPGYSKTTEPSCRTHDLRRPPIPPRYGGTMTKVTRSDRKHSGQNRGFFYGSVAPKSGPSGKCL